MDDLLRGAIDLHLHCSPDVVPRAQDLVELAMAARSAGMAGIGLKDHTTSTVGRCFTLNRMFPQGPRFFSSIALNVPVGGLNPAAVEAALQSGVDIVYFPTYSAAHHVQKLGMHVTPVPHPSCGFQPISVLDHGRLCAEAVAIVQLIARHQAVLATGHLAPNESLALLAMAAEVGVRRMIVTHASEVVPGMTVTDQRQAVAMGAWIEHSLLAVTDCCPVKVPLETIADQISAVGVDHVVLSSDFGQPGNGPPVEALRRYATQLMHHGFSSEEMRAMMARNPARLMNLSTESLSR